MTALSWTALSWTALSWNAPSWTGLSWTGLSWTGLSWTGLADGVAAVLLTVGCLLTLVAAIGMVRLPDLLSRMHAVTKPQVLGLMLVMSGVSLRVRDDRTLGLLLLVVIFQLATSPIASHMVSRATFRAGQVEPDLLLVDELGPAMKDHQEPRGAP